MGRDGNGPVALRVLLLEDSADDAALIVRTLQRRFGEVRATRVETAAALRQALAQGPWDAAISDHTMPGLRLDRAAATLRAGGFTGPLILCTGALRPALEAEARSAGASGWLDKRDLARLPALLRALLVPEETDDAGIEWAVLDDVALRDAALRRIGGAWRELVRRHGAAMRAGGRAGLFAHGGPTDEDAVDEVVGRTWRRVIANDLQNLRDWEPQRGSLAARFFGLALRVAWGLARQERRRQARAGADVPLETRDLRVAGPDEAASAGELSQFVRQWLAGLPADAARILWLRREGQTVREIALRLHTSRSAVHRQLQTLERRLVAELEAKGWRPPRAD